MGEQLKTEDAKILNDVSCSDYGKFVHVKDDEDNKIELWEPVDEVFTTMGGKNTK